MLDFAYKLNELRLIFEKYACLVIKRNLNCLSYLFCITHEILFKNKIFSGMTGVDMIYFGILFMNYAKRVNMKFCA